MRAVALALLLCAAAGPGRAGTLERVRAAGVVRCGAAIRPGVAFPATDRSWHGLAVEMCRAVAAAALGDAERIAFTSYAIGPQFDRAAGADDVAFLTGSELVAQGLVGRVMPGPVVFHIATRVMVPEASAAVALATVGTVCGEPGTGAERTLLEYVRAHGLGVAFSMWQELEEMVDAFAVGRCPAVVGEETALAALGLAAAADGHPVRLLPEVLGVGPLMVATGSGDAGWANVVGWTVRSVLAAEREPGVQGPALPLATPALNGAKDGALGLDAGWQGRVMAAVGTYAEVFDRTLGAGSVLGLRPGVNARWDRGGLFAPVTAE